MPAVIESGGMRVNNDQILKVEEVAALLRVAPSWVYANADFLGAYRIGKYLRFSQEDVFTRLRNKRRLPLGSQPNDPGQSPVR